MHAQRSLGPVAHVSDAHDAVTSEPLGKAHFAPVLCSNLSVHQQFLHTGAPSLLHTVMFRVEEDTWEADVKSTPW